METGFMNRIIGLVIALVVGGLLVGGLLIPTVTGIQDTVGDATTVTNNTNVLLRPAEPGDVLTPSYVDNKWEWALNGEKIEGIGNNPTTWDSFIIADSMYLSSRSAGDNWAATISIFSLNPVVWSGYCNKTDTTANITFGNGEITITGTNSDIYTGSTTIPYTWAYIACPETEATYCAAVSGGMGYVNSTKDLILCGTYTSGENDCAYTYKDGIGTIIGGDYTINVNQTLALKDGTTDIYEDTVSVDIGDENFTPYRIFVPYEVSGHASSGMYYVMFGVISILGIVALVVVAANGIRNKY